jgi:hypothetical protein
MSRRELPMPEVKKQPKEDPQLIHLEGARVLSHRQLKKNDIVLNTLMLEGHEVPFQFRRKTAFRSLMGARVNITYHPETRTVGGEKLETMKVVKIRRA